jgi:ABC-type transport system involved in multi-copper enzyme maturation permease subunit
MVGVALLILFFTLAMAELSLNQERRIVLDIGLGSISLFSVVAAVFLGSSLLYKEIERKTLYVILPKPIQRYEFLLGKYFGIGLTASVFISIMGAVQLWVTSVQAGAAWWALLASAAGLPMIFGLSMWLARDRTAVLVPWSVASLALCMLVTLRTDVELGYILCALLLTLGEVLVVTAVAMLFSSFSTPFLTALFTVGVWLAGRSADSMATMRSKVLPPAIKQGLKLLAEVAPNFNLFVPSHQVLEKALDANATPFTYLGTTMGYAMLYSAILLVFAALIFQRRDLV